MIYLDSSVALVRGGARAGTHALPVAVRTLDGLHLATMNYLQSRGADIRLASYDVRLLEAAAQIGISTVDL